MNIIGLIRQLDPRISTLYFNNVSFVRNYYMLCSGQVFSMSLLFSLEGTFEHYKVISCTKHMATVPHASKTLGHIESIFVFYKFTETIHSFMCSFNHLCVYLCIVLIV